MTRGTSNAKDIATFKPTAQTGEHSSSWRLRRLMKSP